MKNAIATLKQDKVLAHTIFFAKKIKVPRRLHIEYVCNACCNNPTLAPDFNAGRKKNRLTAEQCIEKWVQNFFDGYKGRISQRKSPKPGTVPDDIVNTIIQNCLPNLSSEDINSIVYAHRLSMSAENILGLLLEEFLSRKLSSLGWVMAWGETIKSVDFCNEDGFLLQIKNRSNSENSSSSKIRDGKPIKKWIRINANNGCCGWEKLAELIGKKVHGLNEKSFNHFVIKILKNNPHALAIEDANPWIKIRN